MEDDLREGVYYMKKKFTAPHLDSHRTTDPKLEMLSAVLAGNRIQHDGKIVHSIMHEHVCKKDNFLGKDN